MWKQGEHVAVIGMTGSGKTTLAKTLLEKREWKLMLVSKADDLSWPGWQNVSTAKAINPNRGKAFRLIPPYETARKEFKAALDMAWREGCWCVYLDELYYLEYLGLERDIIKLLTQGRSKRITVVAGVQRPYQVTRFALSEPLHVFTFTLGDRRDLRALSEGVSDSYAREAAKLKEYQFVYFNKKTRQTEHGTSRNLEKVMV